MGRHFLRPETLKHAVDTMSASHLNALHWHMSDDETFPLCLDTLPGLCEQVYRDPWGNPAKYDKSFASELVNYARQRGVRVMLELDLPGHSWSLARAAPHLFVQDCPDAVQPLPDVTNEAFFAFLTSVVKELVSIFPDNYFHGGGDEVELGCWETSNVTKAFMAERGFKSTMELLGYFHQRYQEIVAGAG